jgi:hypothetical protein
MNSHVLYYQSRGSWGAQYEPVVLCVGSLKRCEQMRNAILKDPEFGVIQSRERGGALQIVPSTGGRSVVARSVPFQGGVTSVGGVSRI